MALFARAAAENRVIDTALHVSYARRKVHGSWTYTSGTSLVTFYEAWEYTRTARKAYRYVGMDYDNAVAEAKRLETAYTRNTQESVLVTSGEGAGTFVETSDVASLCMADIAVQHDAGSMYTIVVSVNETDTKLRTNPSFAFETLFAAERARGYDGETETGSQSQA